MGLGEGSIVKLGPNTVQVKNGRACVVENGILGIRLIQTD